MSPSSPGPVLAVCGWSGSGKTTLLEAVIPVLTGRGLRVAVVKHDAHGISVDHPGKDSDRLFRAGADVSLHGPGEALARRHRSGSPDDGGSALEADLADLLADHDLVLVEGHKGTPLPKLWLAGPGGSTAPDPPADVTGVREVLPWTSDRPAIFIRHLDAWLDGAWRASPVRAGILIGGRSRRMGRPKHLIRIEGVPLVERIAREIESGLPGAIGAPSDPTPPIVLGNGELPPRDPPLVRLPDAPGIDGPLGGLLAALRYDAAATWLVVACDLPLASRDAMRWLLDQRRPGCWAVLPRIGGTVHPLLALYDARARSLLEPMARRGERAPSALATHPRAATPVPPEELIGAWRDINTVTDLLGLGYHRPHDDRSDRDPPQPR